VTDESELVQQIRGSNDSDHVITTTLRTDERVIARITDGIYRQPGSALRELISNAYDADATRVVVTTDAPRFQRISIEDDGIGMTPEALAHLLLHIGGSAKRSYEGRALGITADSNPLLSPGGRRLIGKIGIGLFSVAQLTQSFQIITKVKGDRYRTIATVALKHYEDQEAASAGGSKGKFESGKVNIWRERAADVPAHGTSVVLTNIRRQARDTLRSREIWSTIDRNDDAADPDARQA
jgi:HSP90 family molecular chaperone